MPSRSRPRRVDVLVGVHCLAAGAVAAAVLRYDDWRTAPLAAVLALGFISAVAERQSIQVDSFVQTSVAAIPLLFTAVVYGPMAAMMVGACAVAGDFGRPYSRWLVWTSQRMLIGAFMGAVAHLALADGSAATAIFLAVAAAAAAEAVADTTLTAVTVATRHPGRFVQTARALARVAVATLPWYVPLITILVYAYVNVSPWSVLLFVAPAVAAQHLLTLYQRERHLAQELGHANEDLAAATVSFSAALVTALDARDRYTAGHSAAVAHYARSIAEELGLSSEERELAYVAGLLHDIGKVGLPAGILEKEGPLSPEERKLMETHAEVGHRILGGVHGWGEVARVVRHHHERVDGAGYPDCLVRDRIPLTSRIIAVADAYDAMTSGRPYRAALQQSVARARLRAAAGTQFDECVVDAFDNVLSRLELGRAEANRVSWSLAVPEPTVASAA